MSEQTSVRIVRSILELEDLRSIWTSWQRHPNADIDFYRTMISTRPEFVRPHIIVMYRNGCPEAMLIGRVEHRALDLRIGYGRLLKPKAQFLVVGYGGVLGNPSAAGCNLAVREIMSSLRGGEAHLAFFNHLRGDHPLYDSIVRLPSRLSRDHFPNLQSHRSLVLPSSADEFYSGLSKKVRKNQRWQARKFVQAYPGQIRIDSWHHTDELDRLVRDVEEVAKKTYQRGLGVGFADTPEMRQRLRFLAENRWLRAYILYVADRPCAFWIGTLYRNTFHGELTGYDPSYGEHSPGMFLTMKMTESFCNQNGSENIREIDFGLGDAQYKEILSNRKWLDASVYIFAPTIKGIGLNLLRTPLIAMNETARRVLHQTKLLPMMKKLWRGAVTTNVDLCVGKPQSSSRAG